ncbi:hypothetical protein FRC07_001823 [Ceratobasidium sp. 392]|nr:hypothetical protein FRC07_001823 [Ceratobasidium sp. 392]
MSAIPGFKLPPVHDGSPWLKSPGIQKLHNRSQIMKNISPDKTVTGTLNSMLPSWSSGLPSAHPGTYQSTHSILIRIADLLDRSEVTADKHKTAFFPTPGVTPNKFSSHALYWFQLRLVLLDVLLYILFPVTRLPDDNLPSALPPSDLLPTCEAGSTLYQKAEWIIGMFANMDTSIDHLIASMIESDTHLSDLVPMSGKPGSLEHNLAVAGVLDNVVDHHGRATRTHAYYLKFSQLAKGLWGLVVKHTGPNRTDHSEKLLDLATASSVTVPMLSLFFQPKITWGHSDMSVQSAAEALINPAMQLSSPFIVNCKEIMFMCILDMIEQIHSHETQRPVPQVHHLQQWLTPFELTHTRHWYWPTHSPIGSPSAPHPQSNSSPPTTSQLLITLPNVETTAQPIAPVNLNSLRSEHGVPLTSYQVVHLDLDTIVPNAQPQTRLMIEGPQPGSLVEDTLQNPMPELTVPQVPYTLNTIGTAHMAGHSTLTQQVLAVQHNSGVASEDGHLETPLTSEGSVSAVDTMPGPGPWIEPMSVEPLVDDVSHAPEMSSGSLGSDADSEVAQLIWEALGHTDEAGNADGESEGINKAHTTPLSSNEGNMNTSLLDGLLTISPQTSPGPLVPLALDLSLHKRRHSDSSSSTEGMSGEASAHKKSCIDSGNEHDLGDANDKSAFVPFGGPSPLSTAPNSPAPFDLDQHPVTSGKRLLKPIRLLQADKDALSNFSVDDFDLDEVDEKFEDVKPFQPIKIPKCTSVGQFQDTEILIPKVPGQACSLLDQAIKDQAIPRPSSTLYINSMDIFNPGLHLQQEFGKRNIVVLPSPDEVLACKRWLGPDGHIVMDSLIDSSTVVEVHVTCIQGDTKRYLIKARYLSSWITSMITTMPHIVLMLTNQTVAFNSMAALRMAYPLFPHQFTSWHLLSGPGAITCDHVDTAGASTWVQIDSGAKIWLTMGYSKNPALDPADTTGDWLDDLWGSHLSDINFLLENCHWECHYLTPGTVFIMRPHTVHLMLTAEPTLCHGGHFVAPPKSWVIKQRMLLYAHKKLIQDGESSPYSYPDLAALILMCKYQEAFTAQTESEMSSYCLKELVDGPQTKLVKWKQYLHPKEHELMVKGDEGEDEEESEEEDDQLIEDA